jgi:thiamine-phosphate pyrophosphorylase
VNRIPSPLLVITDRHQARRPLEQVVAEVLSAGARWIWFRDRDLEIAERRRLAMRLAKLVRGAGGCLSIGGDVELTVEARTNAGMCAISRPLRGPAAARTGRLVGLSVTHAGVADARAAGATRDASPIYQSRTNPVMVRRWARRDQTRAAQIGIPVWRSEASRK